MAWADDNTIVNSTIIAKESLRMLENELVMAKLVYRDWENKFGKDGSTLGIRKANKFRATKARVRTGSALAESNLTLTQATQVHVSFEWDTQEMTQSLDRISERYVKPALSAIANTIDVDLFDLYEDIYNQVGTPGTAPSDYDVYADAMRRLNEEACPSGDRFVVVNPKGQAETLKGLKGLFNEKLINGIISKGSIGSLAGFDFYMAQNVQVHTTGYFTTGATPLVDGASQTGNTLLTKGWSGSNDVHAGDVFTVAGVYAVNPKTGESTGELRNFVVVSQLNDTAAAMDITIYPSIVTSGATQTVDASPADEAAVTFTGTESTGYPINLAFHRDCLTIAMRPLEIPSSATWGARESYNGLSIRSIKDYDIDEDTEVIRFDALYGVLCQYPELGCRIIG